MPFPGRARDISSPQKITANLRLQATRAALTSRHKPVAHGELNDVRTGIGRLHNGTYTYNVKWDLGRQGTTQ